MFGMGPGPKAPAPPPAKPRAAAPRAPAAGATVSLKLDARLRRKLDRLGGEDWLRGQIERAAEPGKE